MNALFGRLRSHRLASTFTVLFTLSAGILIGSIAAHGVHGQEAKVDSSDARPLHVPAAQAISNEFAAISKEVAPAVVNITAESLPKNTPHRRQRMMPNQPQSPDDNGGDGSDDDDQQQQQGPGQGGDNGMQDFFNRFFGGQMPQQQGPQESLGSGFIVDPRGYIVTNNHVVDKADRLLVKLASDPDGDIGRPAKVVGVDKSTDLAVIKIDPRGMSLPTVKLGNSDAMEVGDWVLAIGSPFGLQHTVTAGIVSSMNRDLGGGAATQFQRFIQTDAAINPGNSGGPLVNMRGEVIGVNTAIYTQSAGYQGVGFAMPSNTVVDTYNDLIGPMHKVVRGSIGIGFQPQASTSTAVGRVYGFKQGVLISSVDPGQPAEKAGLRTGDIITSVDGIPIKDGDQLVSVISAKKPGSSVKIGYMRDGKPMTTVCGIGDREKVLAARTNSGPGDNDATPDEGNATSAKLGIGVRTLTQQQLSRMNLKGGVQVQSVTPGSFADEIGLQPSMIITELNRHAVNSDADLKSLAAGLKSGDDVVFVVHFPNDRTGNSSYIGGTLP